MTSGEIDFVEPLDGARGLRPDDKKRFKKEKYIIGRREVKDLEDLIKDKVSEILSLKFWNGGCGKKDCQWCALRSVMK